MEQRAVWAVGDTLRLSDRDYRVEAVVGMGSNAIVYKGAYQDGLSPHTHTALLKELYPNIPGVARAGGVLCVAPEAQSAFALHRRSYLRGKTGTLTGVKSLSGYFVAGDAEIDFVLILNGTSAANYQATWDALGAALLASSGGPTADSLAPIAS